MAFPAHLVAIIAGAGHDVTTAAAALMIGGAFLGSSGLALAIFKAPPSAASGSPFQVPGYAYYGFLAGTALFGLAEASSGFWAVARDPESWAGIAKFLLWVSILPLCVVVALGSLALVA